MTAPLSAITAVWPQLEAALTPIQSEAQHAQALEAVAPIWGAVGEDAAHPLGSLLALMIERIQTYEDATHPPPSGSPARMLAYLMALRGLSQRALAEATGLDQGNLSKILGGKREFTLEAVRTLAAYFKVEPSLFV
ncbi:helix-turn-helix domain-containing protein [Deinococcus sp.]|uniref:helix-turn-helix domain-containing protein n=1 Tax=Deinococcus sp. TaxID=47478 RepID=UPI0025FEE274|nr:helix-turn-helix domain-containing protein [Deinococcus sp.]